MIRPGWHAPPPDAGPGDAELQTDVMRFFALLAICLVALMSLAREPEPEPNTPRATEIVARTLPDPGPSTLSCPSPWSLIWKTPYSLNRRPVFTPRVRMATLCSFDPVK